MIIATEIVSSNLPLVNRKVVNLHMGGKCTEKGKEGRPAPSSCNHVRLA